MTLCSECGEVKGKYDDPRDPPVDDLLCEACYVNGLEFRIDELHEEIEELNKELIAIRGKPKRKK